MTPSSPSGPATCELQLWAIDGTVLSSCQLAAEPSYSGLERALDCFSTLTALHPRAAIVLICRVAGQPQIVHVRDAGYVFTGRERATINILIHAAELAQMADEETSSHMIARPSSFQQRWFGADNDAANVACAALIDRVETSTHDGELDSYAAYALYSQELEAAAEAHEGVSDTHVSDAIWAELEPATGPARRR